MKKLKKLKAPKLPKPLKRPSAEERVSEALSNVPRITNETVSEHREEVLSSARKYIYPLQHSKNRVVKISLSLFLLVIAVFFTFCGLSLYKFQATNAFIYDVTKIVPFPAAKTDGQWISYESYLFELRHNMHYYHTQQQADFSTKDGQEQLKRLKQQAMAQVVQDAYVKRLAARHGVTVSNQMVDNQLALVRSENRLGNNDRVFRDVLNEFWGWNEGDFKRKLKQQLLTQAVVAKLDTDTVNRSQSALEQLRGGADFGQLAAQMSDDITTKAAGGQYPNPIAANDKEVPPVITSAAFKLKPGQTSGIINTGYTLEILKVTENTGKQVRLSHIQFNFKPIDTFTKPLQQQTPPRRYIKV
jgi:parvulin-like peptidyl-prolyl isomerase